MTGLSLPVPEIIYKQNWRFERIVFISFHVVKIMFLPMIMQTFVRYKLYMRIISLLY